MFSPTSGVSSSVALGQKRPMQDIPMQDIFPCVEEQNESKCTELLIHAQVYLLQGRVGHQISRMMEATAATPERDPGFSCEGRVPRRADFQR